MKVLLLLLRESMLLCPASGLFVDKRIATQACPSFVTQRITYLSTYLLRTPMHHLPYPLFLFLPVTSESSLYVVCR